MAPPKQPSSLPRWFWFASLIGCTPGFKKLRCKKMLKVTMSRIKLLRGRREVQVRQLRRDVAQLLQLGQAEKAESRLDRLWKEHSLLSAYVKIGEFCQLVKVNLRNIAGQRECPMDLKESLASLCFAASCCADLPELQEIRDIMVTKYGKEFLTSAHELLPGEHVNRLFLDAFSTREPLEVSKKALLKGIVAEYNVVQPKRPKVPCIDGGLKKIASLDGNLSNKQQLKQECRSVPESQQHPELNVLEQEETHTKSSKQTRHITNTPTFRAFTEEYASLPSLEGDGVVKMVGRHKKERKGSHFQVSTVQEHPNETDLASQDGVLRGVLLEKHGKEKSRNRQKASRRTARVNQVGQEDEHGVSDRMVTHDKSGPDEAVSEYVDGFHGYGNIALQNLDQEMKDLVNRQQHWEQVHFHSHAKHKRKKRENKDYLAETKEEVSRGPWNHGFHDEALLKDFNAHPMHQEGNLHHKKHDYVESEIYSRFNEKERPERWRNAFENVQNEEHTDFTLAETKSKQYSRSNREEKFLVDFDNMQQERSPRLKKEETQGDVDPRFGKTLRPGKVAHENGNWRRSPRTGNEILADEWKTPPHTNSNIGGTHGQHKGRSNGISRPDSVTYDVNNIQQERSPVRRNHHGDGRTKVRINFSPDKNSRSVKEVKEIENWHVSPKGNRLHPKYVDTHEKQREKIHSLKKNPEYADTDLSLGVSPKTYASQKGRKRHEKRHPFEETQQETQADYSEQVVSERATRCGNFLLTGNRPAESQIHTRWDREEGRQNEPDPEPYTTEHHPEDHGHARQKHKRPTRKHTKDNANATMDGNVELKPEREAEMAVNGPKHRFVGQTNGQFIPEDDSDHVAERVKAHSPQWHNQFDPIPNGSIALEATNTSLPQQVHNSKGSATGLTTPNI